MFNVGVSWSNGGGRSAGEEGRVWERKVWRPSATGDEKKSVLYLGDATNKEARASAHATDKAAASLRDSIDGESSRDPCFLDIFA